MKIKEICVDERPREKMLAKGADAMSNADTTPNLMQHSK